MADVKSTVGFHERYANDMEFKKQVDDGRKRSETKRNHNALKESLAMSRGLPGAKKKRFY